MLLNTPVHVRIVADDLGSRSYTPPVKTVTLRAKPAFKRQEIQVIVDCLAMLLRPKLHIHFINRLVPHLCALWKLIENGVIFIKHRVPVQAQQHLRRYEDPFPPQVKFVRIRIIFHIDLCQRVQRISKNTDAHRVCVIFVCVIDDV